MRLSQSGRYALTTQAEDRRVCRVLAIFKHKIRNALSDEQTKVVDGFISYWIERNQLQEVWRWEQMNGLAREFGYDLGITIPTEPNRGSNYQVPGIGGTRRGKPRIHFVMRQATVKANAFTDAVREFDTFSGLRTERDMGKALRALERFLT